MKTLGRLILSLLLVGVTAGHVSAQGDRQAERPVLSAWTLGLGSSHLADTYLSPLKYQGWSAAIGYERLQASRWSPRDWVMQLKIGGDIDRAENPARNAVMWSAQLHASWGMMRRWNIPSLGIDVGIGPALRLEGGCIYNRRNSNNPASAKGAVTVDAAAYVAKSLNILKHKVTLRYQPTLPVIGAFFSPKYDELYYEMYLGNHSGLVHPAWWGTRFKLDNLVTADISFGGTALRLGYECDWMSSKVSNLTTRMITHRFVIGVAINWLSVKPSKSSIPAL
ncbi:MAG: DUF3316 domain-containing protein [Muribaculaceae bacterium]|nr:DUF3316 domain-containing protein [Muribaculaceae bacterium]